jgi:hypothetical protein
MGWGPRRRSLQVPSAPSGTAPSPSPSTTNTPVCPDPRKGGEGGCDVKDQVAAALRSIGKERAKRAKKLKQPVKKQAERLRQRDADRVEIRIANKTQTGQGRLRERRDRAVVLGKCRQAVRTLLTSNRFIIRPEPAGLSTSMRLADPK